MTGYELVFITDPDLNDEDCDAVLKKAKETLAQTGGSLIHEYLWGRRRLAYEIAGKNFGFYHVWYFSGSGETVDELHRQFGYSDTVLRYQTLKTEDLEAEAAYFSSLMPAQDESPEDDKKAEVSENTEKEIAESSENVQTEDSEKQSEVETESKMPETVEI